MLGLKTSPRRWQEHLSGKLKEHGFVQDERDSCLFVNTELDICIGGHVEDMLAVGPSELTKNLLQELAKDMTMRWGMVNDKPQEFLGRSLCWTPQGYTFRVSCTLAFNGRGGNIFRAMKEMVQRQKDAVFSLGIEFSIKHPLFALLV